MTDSITKLESILGKNRVKKNFNFSPFLTLRTQTKAQYYFEAESRQDLINAKIASIKLNLPLFILGGGSNLAIIKKKLPGLIVRNKYIHKIIEPLDNSHIKLTVSSGYPITKLAKELADQGLEGLEYHCGLPGTVGGALYMNSKWTKPISYVGDNLLLAYLLDAKGNVKKVSQDYFNFAYDYSALQKTHEIVLEAKFKLKKSKPSKTKNHADFALKYRKETQPQGLFCSGCFFKNVNEVSAGKLIDTAGLKGTRVGKFHISKKHANFIIHDGNGKPEELKKLLTLIKNKIKQKFGVKLQEEVIII